MSPTSFIPHPRRPLPRGAASAAVALALAAALLAAGCGYRMETGTLPGEARSLGIGQIRNLTYTGELDVRLKDRLRRRFLANPGFLLTSPEHSELVLEVSLDDLTISRPLDVSDTDLSALIYRLRGTVKVFRMVPEKQQILLRRLNVETRLDFDVPVIETPAVRDKIKNDVILAFAEKVERVLYQHF